MDEMGWVSHLNFNPTHQDNLVNAKSHPSVIHALYRPSFNPFYAGLEKHLNLPLGAAEKHGREMITYNRKQSHIEHKELYGWTNSPTSRKMRTLYFFSFLFFYSV